MNQCISSPDFSRGKYNEIFPQLRIARLPTLPELDVMLGVGVHVAVELHAGVEPDRVEQVGLGPAGRRV